MTRRNRLWLAAALVLALVLGVTALMTLRPVPPAASPVPIHTPEATATDAFAAEAAPTAEPTAAPTPESTAEPTAQPTPEPTETPAPAPETVTITIACHTALRSDALPEAVRAVLPESGVILGGLKTVISDGETVWEVLQRACREQGVALEAEWTPAYNTAYVQGIGHLYEFDCGRGSGWLYRVNGEVPSVGCSVYALRPGDRIEWLYTCDFGNDV